MDILFITQRFPYPPNKGEKIRTYNQIKHLVSEGNNLTVASLLENDTELKLIPDFQNQCNVNFFYEILGSKVMRLLKGFFSFNALSVANFYNAKMQKSINKFLSENNVDVIICSSSSMAEYIFNADMFKANKMNDIHLLMDFMDVDSEKWKQYSECSKFPMNLIYKRESKFIFDLEKKILNSFDDYIIISKDEKKLLESAHGCEYKNLSVVENGIDLDEFPYVINELEDKDAPVFIFTGVMDYKPNVDAVLWFVDKIWPNVIVKYKKPIFLIVGMNPTSQVLKLDTIQGVKVTGFVDNIIPYYQQAHFFVAPFLLARGVQNKVLQAFACGKPVISTSVAASGITCVDTKDILIANTVDEFQSAIDQLIDSKELSKHISINARSIIENNYSWDAKLKKLDEIIH